MDIASHGLGFNKVRWLFTESTDADEDAKTLEKPHSSALIQARLLLPGRQKPAAGGHRPARMTRVVVEIQTAAALYKNSRRGLPCHRS
jgi:hypothetical protein